MLVLHRAKLLASNQSVLALGVAPMRVVSRWCSLRRARDYVRLTSKRPLLGAERQPSTLSPFTDGEWVWGFGKDAEIRTHKGFARSKAHQSVLKGIGIENLLFFINTDFFYKLQNG